MHVPSREALLKELDSKHHTARIAHVARLGRQARATPELMGLLSQLEAGDVYEACLALELARAAGEQAPLLRALAHPSCQVSHRAAALAGRYLQDDGALERALPELSPSVRRRVLKGVALERREALASRLLPRVLARHGPLEASILLPALGEEGVRHYLPELTLALSGGHTLLHRQPRAVLAFLQERLSQAPERERPHLFARYHSALAELSLTHPAQVLSLARDFAPPDSLPAAIVDALPRLTRREPDSVFALLTRPAFRPRLLAEGLPRPLLRHLRALSSEQLRTLARLLSEAPHHLAPLLRALPPSRRAELFSHAFALTSPHLLPSELLATLPHGLRDAQAERQLSVREVREERERALATHALRSIEHAREPLQSAATASKAEERAQALVLLVRCTGLSRRGLAETLTFLTRLKNEQDPVRQAALAALSQLPLALLTPEHLPALAEQVTHATEARDCSPATRAALQELAFRLLRAHAASPEHPCFRFALDTLKRLAAQSGSLALPYLEPHLPRGAEHHLVAALLPLIRPASQRESYDLILSLTRALGRRAWNVDMLQALLEPITEVVPDWLAQSALQLWLAPPRTRDARVRKLLDRDETSGTLPFVFDHLHRRRQDWLDPYLQGRRLKGRYSTGKTGWVPPVSGGFQRWLPRQQLLLRELLLRVAGDSSRSAWERSSVLGTLPRLPVVEADTLTPFLASRDVATVEAALGALAWLDRPAPALPLLLEHLDGDRARVAMYAVPRVARLVPPASLSAALAEVLARDKLKVTVRKEAVRLLGAFRSERSLALLRQQWQAPQLHRDVRIAIGHAARRLLEEPGAWELLDSLASSPEACVASSLLEQSPEGLPVETRRRYAGLVLQVARHPEAQVRRQAFSALPAWSEGAELAVARAAAERVLDLEGGAEWREATQALVEVAREEAAFGPVVSCARALLAAPVLAAYSATPERDMPARQRLQHLCTALRALPYPVRRRLWPHLQEVAHALRAEPSLWPESAALRLCALDWREPTAAAQALLSLGAEVREEPAFAPTLAAVASASLAPAVAEWEPEALLEVSDKLIAEAPLVAVALVAAAGGRLHWREEAARRLRDLRQHPRPAVRAAAFATRTATE